MEKISHYVHQAKQAKFWMLTVPVRTVRTGHVSVCTGHVAGPYTDTWQVPYRTHGGSKECHVLG
jgi:hypothetical protein